MITRLLAMYSNIFIGLAYEVEFPPLLPVITLSYGINKKSAAAWYKGSWLFWTNPVSVMFVILKVFKCSCHILTSEGRPPTHKKLMWGKRLANSTNKVIPRPGYKCPVYPAVSMGGKPSSSRATNGLGKSQYLSRSTPLGEVHVSNGFSTSKLKR